MSSVRFIQYGLGPIGLGIAELALARGYRLTAVFEIDPNKVGRQASDLIPSAPPATPISSPEPHAFAGRAEIVLHSTQSRLAQVFDQLVGVIEAGFPVISTCEELAFPWRHHRREAEELNRRALERRVAVVGLGVNPGFVMDAVPVILTAPCQTIERIVVERVVDLGQRRLPLQKKAGVGLTVQKFQAGVTAGRLAHVGLPESVAMVADALRWDLAEITESIDPVLAPDGSVRGLHQVCRGFKNSAPAITLDLTMATGVTSRDAISIDGTPPLRVEIPGGIPGDLATSAIVVNAIPQVLAAPPGLRLATELPLKTNRH